MVMMIDLKDDDYSPCQLKEAFIALTKDDILRTYISDNDFRPSNNGNGFG